MRLVQFSIVSDPAKTVYLGCEIKTRNNDILPLPGPNIPFSMKDLINGGEVLWMDAAEKANAAANDTTIQLLDRKLANLLSPITGPKRVIGIGTNYKDGAEELKKSIPPHPIVFLKLPSTIIGPNDDVILPTEESSQVDWEVELAVIIGKNASKISIEEAPDHIFGFTVAIDYTARDLIAKNGGLWTLAKNFPTFCPLGPAVVTPDEIPDWQNLSLKTVINRKGESMTMQESNTGNMIFEVVELISYVSNFFPLIHGDVILTGTPAGIGIARNPQMFLEAGDEVTCSIEKIGEITNKVIVSQ